MANTYNICTKLQSIADALGDAQTSDLIDALADIAQAISQGGGGGTSDYTQLTNKPQINGYVLSGNQTSSQLGLQSALTFDNTPTSGSSNPVTSDGVYDAIDTLNSNFTITSGNTNVTGCTWVKMGKIATINCGALAATDTNITGAPIPATNDTFLCSLQSGNVIVGYVLIQNKTITIRSTAGNGYGSLVYFCE